MNIVKFKNKTYKYESVFREKEKTVIYDSKNHPYPFPEHHNKKWVQRDVFLKKLEEVEKYLDKIKKFKKYDKSKSCPLDKHKNISNGLYTLNSIRWEDGLKHYIKEHNHKPSMDFMDVIFRFIPPHKDKGLTIARINGIVVTKFEKKYLKIDRNQMMIMDALMEHGGYKKYTDKNKKEIFRYSEHYGLLDFNNNGLEKFIVSANTTRVDKGDEEIFMPQNMIDALDYEYIFHTHPPTPKVGGRVDIGILYDFPSVSDVFHFLDHYNDGVLQGSLVIAPEGLYNIRKLKFDNIPIKFNEDRFYIKINKLMDELNEEAIEKYGEKFTDEFFYSKIAQDKYYINEINVVMNEVGLHIDYFPRIKDAKDEWVIDTLYLPIYVVEPNL